MKAPWVARRAVTTAVVAAIVAMAIGAVSYARAGGNESSNHTFAVKEVDTAFKFVSISHTKNGAPGDEFIFHARLFSGGKQVGTLDVECTLVLNNKTQCAGTFVLPGGTLSGSALTPANGNNPVTQIAIEGGTGRFAQVRGTAVSTSTGQNSSRDVFHLNY
jgi:hypothetical protein